MMYLLPGDPELEYLLANPNTQVNSEDRLRIRKELGLDDALYVQYFRFVKSFARGEFGWSKIYQVPVSELLPSRIYSTLKLTVPTLCCAVLFGVVLGTLSALYAGRWVDIGIRVCVITSLAAPTFWLGLFGLYVFSVKLAVLPAGGIQSIGVSNLGDTVRHLILPVGVLSMHSIGHWTRYVRSGILDIMRLKYIQMARAHGIPEVRILVKHAFKNISISIVTLLALSIPSLFSGALVTEEIFSIPGMGQLLYQSILHNDRHLAMISFLFLSCFTLVFNLVADVLYFTIDPRISR